MKYIKCNNVSGLFCDVEISGKTVGEIINKWLEHDEKYHHRSLASMESNELEKISKKIYLMIKEK